MESTAKEWIGYGVNAAYGTYKAYCKHGWRDFDTRDLLEHEIQRLQQKIVDSKVDGSLDYLSMERLNSRAEGLVSNICLIREYSEVYDDYHSKGWSWRKLKAKYRVNNWMYAPRWDNDFHKFPMCIGMLEKDFAEMFKILGVKSDK